MMHALAVRPHILTLYPPDAVCSPGEAAGETNQNEDRNGGAPGAGNKAPRTPESSHHHTTRLLKNGYYKRTFHKPYISNWGFTAVNLFMV
jgi:hypothetical protein